MHRCLDIPELLNLIASCMITKGPRGERQRQDLVSLAVTCRGLTDTVLNVLWKNQSSLTVLLKCFPNDLWTMRSVSSGDIAGPVLVRWTLSE